MNYKKEYLIAGREEPRCHGKFHFRNGQKQNRKRMLALALCLNVLWGCSHGNDNTSAADHDASSDVISYDADDWYSDYDPANVSAIDLSAQSGNVTITKAGTYELSGTLKGSVEINVGKNDTVRLILNNATIQAKSGPAIISTQGEKLILSMPSGTKNAVSDGAYDSNGSGADAAIFVQDDLTINGEGQLSVTSGYYDAIKTKDTLKLMSGSYVITAADDGIVGRDFIYVHDGAYVLEVSGDAMKTTYDTDDFKGDIIIENGTFDIQAGNDGIQSEHRLSLYDGNYKIQTGGGSVNGVTAENAFEKGGFGRWNEASSNALQSEDTPSAKGIKSGSDMVLYGGIYDMDTSDDSFHSNANLTIKGGNFTIASGDDGFHSDAVLTLADGSVDVIKSYEGLEGSDVIIHGGYLLVKASDDGINAAGGSDGDNASQPSPDHFMDSDHVIEIHGGAIQVDAMGDGLDSNSSIVMNGGSAVICGPDDGANGALDYEGVFAMNGGILVALGSSQMAMAPSSSSKQYGLMIHTSMQEAKSIAYLSDEAGNMIIGFTSPRAYSSIVISTPQLQAQQTYQLYVNASGGNVNDNGYIESGIQEGTLAETITLSQQMTVSGNAGMNGMEFHGGMRDQGGMETQGREPMEFDGQFPQEPPQMKEGGKDAFRQ